MGGPIALTVKRIPKVAFIKYKIYSSAKLSYPKSKNTGNFAVAQQNWVFAVRCSRADHIVGLSVRSNFHSHRKHSISTVTITIFYLLSVWSNNPICNCDYLGLLPLLALLQFEHFYYNKARSY